MRRELREAAEPERVPEIQRLFKTGPGGYGEGDVFLGVRVPAVRFVARRHADLNLEDVTKLLRSPLHEERLAALVILIRRYGRVDEQQRQRIYDLYLGNKAHVNSWDLVDVSAPHIVGAHLLDRRGAEHRVLDRLAYSPSVWERRIAIMGTFAFVRAGQCDETLRLARVLLDDENDLIHKAVGWMLREVGKRDEELLLGFLQHYAGDMPRTMLRYAVERLDAPVRAELMAVGRRRTATVGVRSRAGAEPEMRAFGRPVRIIFGEADRSLNAGVARDFHEKFPNSELFLLPTARHFPQLDEPEEVARLILSTPLAPTRVSGDQVADNPTPT